LRGEYVKTLLFYDGNYVSECVFTFPRARIIGRYFGSYASQNRIIFGNFHIKKKKNFPQVSECNSRLMKKGVERSKRGTDAML